MAWRNAWRRLRARLVRRPDASRAVKISPGSLRWGPSISSDGDSSASDEAVGGGIARIAESERRELARIAQTLERIASGDYGRCEFCGGAISEARLAALPYANSCIACQRELEREAPPLAGASRVAPHVEVRAAETVGRLARGPAPEPGDHPQDRVGGQPTAETLRCPACGGEIRDVGQLDRKSLKFHLHEQTMLAVIHDLRNPINIIQLSIRMAIDVCTAGEPPSADLLEDLGMISENINNLSSMVTALREFFEPLQPGRRISAAELRELHRTIGELFGFEPEIDFGALGDEVFGLDYGQFENFTKFLMQSILMSISRLADQDVRVSYRSEGGRLVGQAMMPSDWERERLSGQNWCETIASLYDATLEVVPGVVRWTFPLNR